MFKQKKFYYFIILLVINLAIYINLANAFIYFRIGEGDLIIPVNQNSYYMTDYKNGTEIKYVALGDSLTAGSGAKNYQEMYPYLLAKKISEAGNKVTYENYSQPGAKSQDLIDILLTPAIAASPNIVTLLIGINDIHNHVGKDQFRKNYQFILERLTKETKAKIYLINIPSIGSNTIILPPLNYYFDKETSDYNKIIKELADVYKVKYIDLNSPIKNLFKNDGTHYSVDSFHPSALGYKLWAQIIYDHFN